MEIVMEEETTSDNNGWETIETIETTNSENQMMIKPKKPKIINKGTGAGGENTNKNGLQFEEVADLKDRYESIQTSRNGIGSEVKFKGHLRTFIKVSKSALQKYMDFLNYLTSFNGFLNKMNEFRNGQKFCSR